MAEDYLQQVLRIRQDRAQAQQQQLLEEIRQAHAQAAQTRADAEEYQDEEAWHEADTEMEQLEREYQRNVPPQTPAPIQKFINNNPTFFNRYGATAHQALQKAVTFATNPRDVTGVMNTNSGMGMNLNDPQLTDRITDLMEMYASDFGLTFAKESPLTPNDAAAAAGVSHKTYNNNVHKMRAQRADTASRFEDQYKSRMG